MNAMIRSEPFDEITTGKKGLSDELTALTAKLMLCSSRQEIIRLSNEFGQLIENVIEQEKIGYTPERITQTKAISATIKFTRNECVNMDKIFKKDFIEHGSIARVIKRKSGKNTFVYEIRYRRNGISISASATDLEKAKKKFLEMTSAEQIKRYTVSNYRAKSNLFEEIAEEYFDFKRGKICDKTIERYRSLSQRLIYPVLGNVHIAKMRTSDIDNLLKKANTPRIREDLRVIFNSVYKYAIGSGLTTYNPVFLVPFIKAERTNRRALTNEELRHFIKRLNLPKFEAYKRTYLIYMFFGLRPCELHDARFENGFLIARNAKRKNGKIEYKKIPICEQAKELLDITSPIKPPFESSTLLNKKFKEIMGEKDITLYYLRHTFATICQQYVRPDIVDIWMGDSPERLVGRVYTHFSDEFMQEQIKKVKFEI